MPVVARIEVPPPEPFVEGEDRAEAKGAGYRFVAPRTATEPLVFQSAQGLAFLWTPTELVYGDADGMLDYIAGSAPAAFTVRGRSVHYPRTFPASEEVHVATPDGRKYWLYLYEPPRQPAPYLSGDLWFGVSGKVGGIPLPPGRHQAMEAFGFRFQPVYAEDTMGARVEGWYQVVDTDAGQQLFICIPAGWLLDPDRVYPVKIDPSIVESGVGVAWASNERVICRFSDGTLLTFVRIGSSRIECRYSKDNGQSWHTPAGGAYVTDAFRMSAKVVDDKVFIVATALSVKKLMIGVPSNGNTAFTWTTNDISGSAVAENPDMDVHRADSGWIAHIVSGYKDSSVHYTRYARYRITSDLSVIIENQMQLSDTYQEDWQMYPSIFVDPDTLRIYAAWGAGANKNLAGSYYGIRFREAAFNGSTWVWNAEETVFKPSSRFIQTSIVASKSSIYIASRFDGNYTVQVMKRALSGGSWQTVEQVSNADYPALAVDRQGNVFLVYIQGGVNGGKATYRKYGMDGSIEPGPVIGPSSDRGMHVSVRKEVFEGSALDIVFLDVSSSTLMSETFLFNAPPQAPSNLTRPPFDATYDATFTWQHNDEPGDRQSSFHLQIRLAGSDTDLVDTGEVQSPVSQYILPGGTLENGRTYQWRVRTADQAGEWSPWSDYAVFQTGPKPQATILHPTAGATVSTSEVTVEWSVSNQSAATVRLYDGAGQTVLQEHEVTTPSARAKTITGLENNTSYQVSVQPVSSIGVVGDEVFSGPFTVQYTPPPKPEVTAEGQQGFIRITITNPHPTGDEPEVTHNDIYRREPGGAWVRIATGIAPDGAYDDYAVGSGVVYEYRARAVGANGTYTDSEPVSATVTFDEWRFSPVDGQPEILFRFDSSVTWRPEEDVQVPRTMSRYQRTYRNPSYPRVATIQARFRDGEDGLTVREQRERLLRYIEQGVVGWLRGPHGDCWRGVLLEPEVLPSTHFARETVTCVFRETREAP